ncbi:ornithine decarboxylase-like [Patiria miniata]|uniref:Orn/DAP/Arg decarboxylase 2 N-terminal domain-containing protein n=1 Tax=Patiria miniata TaxID=46514 RepID=A0A914A1V2_PATMI|nr:ornithine decarboxylase-like [Patiria miniata]XP_038057821.1 ornithine decarboxylase-like [Patiria miniata]XP_038057822.1 ornithine decarboxylase-like [Patiria miniata]XP_038057823.1 ornithine decarboxylase-like [Patiria miniata]
MEQFESTNFKADIYTKQSISDIARWTIEEHLMVEQDYGDPFYICDLGDVIAKDRQWQELLPTVETFYAVKCNPDPAILKLMVGRHRSFDCASKREIEMVLDAGASPDRIIYANPYKQVSHLRYAKEKGVSLMTFDTMEELQKVKRVYPEAKLVLRMLFDDPSAVYKLGSKFGCPLDDIPGLMQLAKALAMEIIGVSFHIGSGASNPEVFSGAISCAKSLFDAGRALGHDMKLLDIGGGYPGRENFKPGFQQFADAISESLKRHFPSGCGVRVIAEPGTYYVESAVHLVANVIATRDGNNNGADQKSGKLTKYYYLNTGLYNSFSPLFTDPNFFAPPYPLRKLQKDEPLYPSCIWGPTCDATDCLFPDCKLPLLTAGDFVIFQNMGAYASSTSCDFNGFGTPKSYYVAPKESLPILREIFQDSTMSKGVVFDEQASV